MRAKSSDRPVTILCGAGVSVDAGLPTWPTLIDTMIDGVDEDLREILRADASDPQRKAEYVARMGADNRKGLPERIRDALYDPRTEVQPGLIADSVARLSVALAGRSRLATTNFDNVLELALGRIHDVAQVKARPLAESDEWATDPISATSSSVLHLHGQVVPGRMEHLDPLVLTETSFRESAATVSAVIEKAISEGVTILVGMSLADPNVVGPLARIRDSGRSGGETYLLSVPDHSAQFESVDEYRYLLRRAEYFGKSLGLRTVALKSFSQVSQVLYDLALAVTRPKEYLGGNSRDCCRYGFRLNRTLNAARTKLGIEAGRELPEGTAARALSDGLRNSLNAPDGPTAFISTVIRSRHRRDLAPLGLSAKALDGEGFALFLWLRSQNGTEHPDYTISQVGTSAYAHTEAWSAERIHLVQAGTGNPAVNAAFYGKRQLVELSDQRAHAIWKTVVAVPLFLSGEDDMDFLNLGAVCLHSNRRLYSMDELTELGKQRLNRDDVSALSIMSTDEIQKLSSSLLVAAEALIK